MQRALESVPDDNSQLSEPIKNLIIGLDIVDKEIIKKRFQHLKDIQTDISEKRLKRFAQLFQTPMLLMFGQE